MGSIDAKVVDLPDTDDPTVRVLVADIKECPLCRGTHFEPLNLLEEKVRIVNFLYEYWVKCPKDGNLILFRIHDDGTVRAAVVHAPSIVPTLEKPNPK